MAEVVLNAPMTLSPGQWLTAEEGDVALFDQPAPDRLRLLMPETLPDGLTLQLRGTVQPIPRRAVLIGQGLPGLGGVLHAARAWKDHARLLALLALDALPFEPAPSRIWLPHLPPEAIATLPLLEDWGVPCRLCGPFPGATDQPVQAVAEAFVQAQPEDWAVLSFG